MDDEEVITAHLHFVHSDINTSARQFMLQLRNQRQKTTSRFRRQLQDLEDNVEICLKFIEGNEIYYPANSGSL